ncbi:DUF3159 domain-containing protein [Mycetocola reblochoni]|uniref:DUF3159 domain-containing protein n=1 Tax=Mycetocola reblochoni TaxID=331618 RepID=UPI003F9C3D89
MAADSGAEAREEDVSPERSGGDAAPDGRSESSADDAAAPTLRDAIAGAARKAGLESFTDGSSSTGAALLAAIGGVRGIVEAVVPGFLFVAVYVISDSLPLSLLFSVGAAVLFTVVRLIQRTPFVAALGGLGGVVLSAVFALMTGRAEDNFVYGFVVNGVSASALLLSIAIGWPLVGVIAEVLVGDGTSWRTRPGARRFYGWVTAGWVGLFVARLLVQVPLWAGGQVAALGVTKLVMGLPLYAPALVVTWLLVRAWLARNPAGERSNPARDPAA